LKNPLARGAPEYREWQPRVPRHPRLGTTAIDHICRTPESQNVFGFVATQIYFCTWSPKS